MGAMEEWLEKERGKPLTEHEKKVVERLKEGAKLSLYCQMGGGQCMARFGQEVAHYAAALGVKPADLFRKLLDEASEALSEGDFDF
ncbi:MAG: hypothetical protein OD815_001720 [Candidatus Alkanophagales archaeon MCA70_species_2]|nr:hypothetical protein [Candidatus Alkanophaga liquidiphilum]RLG38264.1 MAG: hypothetical protein DRN91_03200 [Candidatus Alkanophagales archaeon]